MDYGIEKGKMYLLILNFLFSIILYTIKKIVIISYFNKIN